MRPFRYERPRSLAAAIDLLTAGGTAAAALAGGTDLIIGLRDGSARPDVVVDLKGIDEIEAGIRLDGDRLVIGARAVMEDIARDARVRRDFMALAEAAAVVGSVQIRNRATLAGNICNASPAADTSPALLVYGAEVVAVGPRGARRIPIDDFFLGPGVTALMRRRTGYGRSNCRCPRAGAAACTCAARVAAATTWHRSRSPVRSWRTGASGSPTAASARGRTWSGTTLAC